MTRFSAAWPQRQGRTDSRVRMGPEQPVTSVIVPAYRAWATLPLVLEALEPQIDPRRHEAILVESSGTSAEELERRWPWLRVITLSGRALPGKARNVGVQQARSPQVAFLDADGVPERGWLDALEEALTHEVDAVAGAVVNGTPYSPTGTAGYLLEFSDWLPRRRGAPLHGPTCNLIVRKHVLDEAGGFLEHLLSGEDTILTLPLGRARRLGFAPGARVRHLNRTGWKEYLRHQRGLGVSFASVAASVDFPFKGLARPALVPLTPILRLISIGRRLAPHPREAATAVLLLPLLAAGTVSWAAGLAQAQRRSEPNVS